MAPRYYYRNSAGDTVELTDRIDRRNPPTLKEMAEEGAVGFSTVVIADPGMDLDLDGLRRFWVIEDDSESTDDVVYGGFIGGQDISRGEGDAFQPLGRVWACELYDTNSIWNRRVMTGSDCRRPAETDVDRVDWMLGSAESGIFDDVTTYVYSSPTTNMDKADYRGQYRDQVIGDASQASGKNWWVQYQETGSGREDVVWYGLDSENDYRSELWLSNDPDDWTEGQVAAGTSLVWPISEDTKLRRDPSRVYSGVYLRYEKGAVYRHDSDTTTAFARRDYVASYPNVKTKAKAIARATRLLNKLDSQDERITTTVRLPKGKATMIRAGMEVPFKATHFEDYDDQFYWLRVLSCAVAPHESGDLYDLTLELAPSGNGAAGSGPPEQYAGVGGVVWQPGDQPGSDEVDWNGTGDAPPTGYAFRALDDTNFEYLAGVADATNFGGFTVLATGPILIDLHARWSAAWVGDIAPTATASILKNGVVVASQSRTRPTTGLGYWAPLFEFGASAVSVSAGDELTTELTLSDGTHPAIPAGGGNILDGFQIVDAS